VMLVKRADDPDFVKVLDFGISKMLDSTATPGRAATKTGAVMGTAYYMSPEQAQGKKTVDHRTDVWAIGVILHRALTGHYPFDDESYPMLIMKICTEEPPPIRALRPDVPEALAAIVARCMDRNVETRFESCAAVRAALIPYESMTAPPPSVAANPFESTMPSGGATPAMPIPATARRDVHAASGVRPRATRSWAPVAGLTVVAGLVSGGFAWVVFDHDDDPPPTAIASPVTPIGAAPPTSTANAPPSAQLDFIVSPSEAVVLIDGHPISAVDGELHHDVVPDDTTLHELRVEARGFRSRVENLRLSYPQRIVVALDPGTGVDDRREGATSTPTGGGPHRPRPSVAEAPHTTATTTGAPAVSRVDPPASTAEQPRPERAPDPPPATDTHPTEGVVAPPPRTALKRLVIP